MRKKLSTLLLSVLVLGVLAIPVNNFASPNGGNLIKPLIDWIDPSAE